MSEKANSCSLRISGMDCPDCAKTIEKDIAARPRVRSANVDYLTGILTFDGDNVDLDEIRDRIKSMGYGSEPMSGKGLIMTTFLVPDMDCADEERIVRKALGRVDTVSNLNFDLIGRKVTVTHNTLPSTLREAILREGLEARILDGSRPSLESPISRNKVWSVVISAFLVALGALIGYLEAPSWFFRSVILIAVIIGGWRIGLKGFIAARRLRLDMNFLMSSAVIGAMIIGEWIEAGTVIVLFAIAQLLESYSLDKSRKAIKSLMDLAPQTATVIRDGQEMIIPAEEVNRGDIALVKPGEKIPVDGEVVSGNSRINQAAITGESLPVMVSPGGTVYAGTINGEGAIEIEAIHVVGDTTLDTIIRLVEEARASRAPSQGFVDKFAAIYTPAVVGIAVLIAVLPPLLYGAGWIDWIYRSLTLLVIACPCALVISTPVTIVSALTAAARNGVLIKGGAFLENLHKIKSIAFDKTGTITVGIPAVREIIPLEGADRELVIRIAASIERRSEHPIGAALVRHADELSLNTEPATDFQSIPGKGAKGFVSGIEYMVGSQRMFEDSGICDEDTLRHLDRVENESQTAIMVGTASKALGIIAVADQIRPEAAETVGILKNAGMKRITMLSGDNQKTAMAVGQEIKVSDVRAELLPSQKVEAIRTIRESDGSVVMVGDGVNDAPALAASDVGIAMGAAGSDVALDTADIALTSDELLKIPWTFRLSKRAYEIIVLNIAMAIGIKAVFIVLASVGLATLWMAVFADMGVSLMVIVNGMRALKNG
jgi:Cd2+/Zn2+-exporting ATPase